MSDWLKNLFSSDDQQPADQHENNLGFQSEIQALKLELDERTQSIQHLQDTINSLQAQLDSRSKELATSHIASLYSDLASPLSQILVQKHLLEEQNKPVQPSDVMQVIGRIVRILENHGLEIFAHPGAVVQFDPSRHASANPAITLSPNQPVTIRLAGISYQGKILFKAIVEPI